MVGPSSTWQPLLRASWPSASPTARTSAGFQVAPSDDAAREARRGDLAAEGAAARADGPVGDLQLRDAEARDTAGVRHMSAPVTSDDLLVEA